MPIFAAMLFRHLHCLLVFLLLLAAPAGARRPPLGKLSPLLRQLVRQEPAASRRPTSDIALPSSAARCPAPDICALALVSSGDPAAVLREHGCRELDRVGRISIAAIPVDRLAELTCDERVSRVEAHPRCSAQTDVTAGKVGVGTVHAGTALPQAFTGRGVVVGVMDIGFDLTHPNFYDATATDYRISRLWDMLSTDTVGSTFYVGRDYRGRDELLTLARYPYPGHCGGQRLYLALPGHGSRERHLSCGQRDVGKRKTDRPPVAEPVYLRDRRAGIQVHL